MSAIAAFRTAILKLLDDASSTRFTSAQVDQALIAVLNEYNRIKPLVSTYNVDGTGEYIIEMPADFQPIHVIKVELHDENTLPQLELKFQTFTQDSQWFIELTDTAVSSTRRWISPTPPPTPLTAWKAQPAQQFRPDEPALQAGAAGYAAMFRAVSRAESVNLQPDVAAALLKISYVFLQSFRSAVRKSPPLRCLPPSIDIF